MDRDGGLRNSQVREQIFFDIPLDRSLELQRAPVK
jgi:hypothetical protein